MGLWLRTRQFFAKANTEEPITREDEQQFLEMKSEITKYQRTVTPKMPAKVGFGGERMTELLRQSISISHLRGLPKSDRTALLSTWHLVFILLTRAVGALKFIAEGYTPSQAAKGAGGSNISDLKKAAGKKSGEKPAWLTPKFWIILVLVAGGVYLAYVRLQSAGVI